MLERSADHDRRQLQPRERVDARIVDAQVDHQHAVDAVLAPPAPVDLDFRRDVVDHLEREPDRARRQLELDACDERHRERLERQEASGSREDEAAGVDAPRGERASGPVRVPAELAGDSEDALPRLR